MLGYFNASPPSGHFVRGGGGGVSCGIIRRGPVSKPRKLERQMLQNIAGSFVGHIWHVKSQAKLHKNTLQWRHNERDGVSNHQSHDCLLNRLFRSKKTSQLRVIGLCAGNSPETGEFPAQRASNAGNVFARAFDTDWSLCIIHKKTKYQ